MRDGNQLEYNEIQRGNTNNVAVGLWLDDIIGLLYISLMKHFRKKHSPFDFQIKIVIVVVRRKNKSDVTTLSIGAIL